MNFAILLPCWIRYELTEICLKQLETIKENITVFAVLSKEDTNIKEFERIFKETKVKTKVVYESNEFLGKKHNAGVKEILKNDFDYMINLGSDDLLHPKIFDLYKSYIDKKIDVIGLNELYFFEYPNNCLFFKYYNKFEAVGAGRFLRVEKIKQLECDLYTNEKQRGLDSDSFNNLEKINPTVSIVNAKKFPYVVDVKTNVNINSFESVKTSGNKKNIVVADKNTIFENFSFDVEKLKVKKLELKADANGNIKIQVINNKTAHGVLSFEIGAIKVFNFGYAENMIKKGFFKQIE